MQLRGEAAADLLSAWTTLWHPALIDATGNLPGWHAADDLPEPESIDAELILLPTVSRERLPIDWRERVAKANPGCPAPLEALPSRAATVVVTLAAAGLAPERLCAEVGHDFLALGYAHLQVELLTRAMHYTTVLDADEFRSVVIGAAQAAVAGENERARDGLRRAFDMLTNARHHFYGVDFYLIDVTLLAATTLGDSLRAKLAGGLPTSLLATASLLERLALLEPATLASLRQAIETDRACVLAGPLRDNSLQRFSPEDLLAELLQSREVYGRLLQRQPGVYGQFGGSYSPLLPEILHGLKFQAALYTAFDGQRCERSAQAKSRWGEPGGTAIDILSTLPLELADPGTWLSFGERVAETLMRDHVATLLVASWPGQTSEYYGDLRRIANYGGALGKFVTLEEYFQLTTEPDDWTSFRPTSYPFHRIDSSDGVRAVVRNIAAYRHRVRELFDRLNTNLAAIVQLEPMSNHGAVEAQTSFALNPWNFAGPSFLSFDPLGFSSPQDVSNDFYAGNQRTAIQSAFGNPRSEVHYLPTVPGCGFAALTSREVSPPVPLAQGRTLRNEFLEVVVSESTGGLQSVRTYRDRHTRVSQRLVMHDRRLPRRTGGGVTPDERELETTMVADRVEVGRNDAVAGEIVARGRLLDVDQQLLAEFGQTSRIVRGFPVVIVDVWLRSKLPPEGDIWRSYVASRLAWREEAVTLSHGVDWTARETAQSHIESPEWVDIADAGGHITSFGLGLPLHRLAGTTWLDTLLPVAGGSAERFQFAIGIDCGQPTQTALALLTAGRSSVTTFPSQPASPTGWFFHVGAKHVLITHLQRLAAPRDGVRLRLLETKGQAVRTSLSAYRPFRVARRTDFRGELVESLTLADGGVPFEIGAHGWIQIEAEW